MAGLLDVLNFATAVTCGIFKMALCCEIVAVSEWKHTGTVYLFTVFRPSSNLPEIQC